jgi:4-diphosphocytidyl-2-C-methyl-D-erythritol kinase
VRSLSAFAKINLGLVVGPMRPDGKHDVATVLQRIDLCDMVELEPVEGGEMVVEGFADTIVRRALNAFAEATGTATGWRVRIDKHIPVAAGLGGGSSDAAAALRLANELATNPLPQDELRALAAGIGADVPFFLEAGAMLATGDGSDLEPLELPVDYWVVLVLPRDTVKGSTAAVYELFDQAGGPVRFEERRIALLSTLDRVVDARDLAGLPLNDLAASPLAGDLTELGAFRADVSGAGPAVYALFSEKRAAARAARELQTDGDTWLVRPVVGQ